MHIVRTRVRIRERGGRRRYAGMCALGGSGREDDEGEAEGRDEENDESDEARGGQRLRPTFHVNGFVTQQGRLQLNCDLFGLKATTGVVHRWNCLVLLLDALRDTFESSSLQKGHDMRRLLLALPVLLSALPALAVEDADRSQGRDVIGHRIEAFRRDDAAGAFAFAAPAIREMFGTGEAFLDMVRRGYPPVHRPRSFSFGEARDLGEGFEQSVAIQDETGIDWDAVYTFERQPDGTWKIAGCRLVKRPGESA